MRPPQGAPLSAEERFCLAEFGPWVKDADGARRCLAFLRDREKARTVAVNAPTCRRDARLMDPRSRAGVVVLRVPDAFPLFLQRVFDLGKAQDVIASLKEEHAKRYPPFLEEPVPFDLPKTWPGLQLVGFLRYASIAAGCAC